MTTIKAIWRRLWRGMGPIRPLFIEYGYRPRGPMPRNPKPPHGDSAVQ